MREYQEAGVEKGDVAEAGKMVEGGGEGLVIVFNTRGKLTRKFLVESCVKYTQI